MLVFYLSDERFLFLRLGVYLLGLGYLFSEICFKGNVYGVGCSYSGLGKVVFLYFYCDFYVSWIFDVFNGLIDYIKDVDWI